MQQELELGNTITTKNDTVLLVGVTGGTGSSVLSGLLASGVPSSTLCVLTRNPTSDAARRLASRGVRLVAGDLDDPSTVDKALEGERHLSEFWFSEISFRSPFSLTHLNVNTVEGFLQLFMDFGIGYASVHQQYMQELYLELFSTS